jgi:hypothetical protein
MKDVTEREEWDAWLKEAEYEYNSAVANLATIVPYDYGIINYLPAARARVKAAKSRYQERLTAYVAFVEAHKK